MDNKEAHKMPIILDAAAPFAVDIRTMHAIIIQAIQVGANEIHITPNKTKVFVSLRIRTQLVEVMHMPNQLGTSLINRFKVMAEISDSDQEGVMWVSLNGNDYHLIVFKTPTEFGDGLGVRIPV